jgi:hypothetical protein
MQLPFIPQSVAFRVDKCIILSCCLYRYLSPNTIDKTMLRKQQLLMLLLCRSNCSISYRPACKCFQISSGPTQRENKTKRMGRKLAIHPVLVDRCCKWRKFQLQKRGRLYLFMFNGQYLKYLAQ